MADNEMLLPSICTVLYGEIPVVTTLDFCHFHVESLMKRINYGLEKKIVDHIIFNQSKGKSGSYAHAARVGMQNHSKGKSLLHLTSSK
jgi:hypothetical protein